MNTGQPIPRQGVLWLPGAEPAFPSLLFFKSLKGIRPVIHLTWTINNYRASSKAQVFFKRLAQGQKTGLSATTLQRKGPALLIPDCAH